MQPNNATIERNLELFADQAGIEDHDGMLKHRLGLFFTKSQSSVKGHAAVIASDNAPREGDHSTTHIKQQKFESTPAKKHLILKRGIVYLFGGAELVESLPCQQKQIDGMVYTFDGEVVSCLEPEHYVGESAIDPCDPFRGEIEIELNTNNNNNNNNNNGNNNG